MLVFVVTTTFHCPEWEYPVFGVYESLSAVRSAIMKFFATHDDIVLWEEYDNYFYTFYNKDNRRFTFEVISAVVEN